MLPKVRNAQEYKPQRVVAKPGASYVCRLIPLVLCMYIGSFFNLHHNQETASRSVQTNHSYAHDLERQRLCDVSLEAMKPFENRINVTGSVFLRDKGVILSLPSKPVVVKGMQTVRVPIYNCGHCKDPNSCQVSMHARLNGERAIRSAEVHQDKNGDYFAEFVAPPISGSYELHVSTRWWHGHEFPTTFLGGPARQKLAGTDIFKEREASCVVSGSPLTVEVMPASERPTIVRKECMDMNGPGYWKRVEPSILCPRGRSKKSGECFVLDESNRNWHWKGDDCNYKLLEKVEVEQCLEDTSILVYGDSLSTEVYNNLVQFVPQLEGRRINGRKMIQYFGNYTVWGRKAKTKRIVVITDFNVAHLIHNPMDLVRDEIAPTLEKEWRDLQEEFGAKVDIQGIFYTGYPPYCERINGISAERMNEANHILAKSAKNVGIRVFNTSAPLLSRPDASWDGFHFLRARQGKGGVSKTITMILLRQICGIPTMEMSSAPQAYALN